MCHFICRVWTLRKQLWRGRLCVTELLTPPLSRLDEWTNAETLDTVSLKMSDPIQVSHLFIVLIRLYPDSRPQFGVHSSCKHATIQEATREQTDFVES